jgi:hypothetical protein
MSERRERLTLEPDYAGRPKFEWSYPKRPSWKAYGEGRATIKITKDDGGLSITASEFPDTIKGGKEVMLNIPKQHLAKLIKFLQTS